MSNEILGIDIGGTGIKGAVVDVETGTLITERFRIKTPRPATPEAVAETVGQIVQHFEWKGPIGIGFPAVIKDGIAFTAGNIHPSWIGTDAQRLFEQASGCTVTIANDADAAGLAEIHLGAGKDRDGVVIMVTLGTGIGTAIFHDGKLFPNTELGHLIIRKKDAERRAANSAREKHDWSWKKWGKKVTEYLAELDRLLWPDLFIIGGGASNEWEKLSAHIKVRAEIIPAKMANIAGIVGAALVAQYVPHHNQRPTQVHLQPGEDETEVGLKVTTHEVSDAAESESAPSGETETEVGLKVTTHEVSPESDSVPSEEEPDSTAEASDESEAPQLTASPATSEEPETSDSASTNTSQVKSRSRSQAKSRTRTKAKT